MAEQEHGSSSSKKTNLLVYKNLTLFQIIIKAVRLNARTSGATDLGIINCIKLWLAQSKNRLKNKRLSMNNEEEKH
ncbi:hypothetical protein RN001_005578 [Aquatica leii]|uniref:Uncharacterized protein n=1 Tax=Aquatica leii TaxID=1421715 RepID=A0AAN7Q0I7_9COLE|nr:hypothetical protein RN001_005578 [Aquatica leii]